MTAPCRGTPCTTAAPSGAAALKVLAITIAVVVASSASVAAFGVWSLGRTVAANAVDISNGGAVPTIAAMNGASTCCSSARTTPRARSRSAAPATRP